MRTFRIGGIHPEENKLSAEIPTVAAPLPKQAVFPLSQHIGAPAKPVVQKGDHVKVGTLIAEAGGFVSAPIYSSVSGTVFKVDTTIDASGYRKPAIIINVEGDEWYVNLRRYGGCIHSGFGMGFERLIMYLTGIENIRDVIPYPRTPGSCEF